jgi:para-nitrobenzyl esterase
MADDLRAHARAQTLATPESAIVETASGKLRGAVRAGLYVFKGVPYGADTGGSARFQPPRAPAPWPGVRSALAYGPVCPQVPRAGWSSDEHAFLFDWDDGFPGEDCLRLNIWTPALSGARPVMVWLHGGGFEAGSSQELPAYDGENLARRGDIVVVSVNHRLGPFGYLDGAAPGSANAGMLDLVRALEWVRETIAAFGGDAGNVTLFGQSGGGAKINTLMAMPAAAGLFHKAIVQSGSQLRLASPQRAAEVAAAMRAAADGADLAAIPAARLVEIGAAAARTLRKTPRADGGTWEGAVWQPTCDGAIVADHPGDAGALARSASIPLLVGSTFHESSPSIGNVRAEAMDEARLLELVARTHKARAGAVIAAFRRGHPHAKPVEIASLIQSTQWMRVNAVRQAVLKAQAGGAPAYLYWFGWKTPVLDGRPRAFHCSELAFCFDNIDRCLNHTGGGGEARALAARMADAWIAFARAGDPNHPGLPAWAPVTPEALPTMMFDAVCDVRDNPDREERAALTP